MSINIGGVPANLPVNAVATSGSIGFQTGSASVQATPNSATVIQAGFASLPLTALPGSAQGSTNVAASTDSVGFSTFQASITATVPQQDTNITAGAANLPLSANNAGVSSGTLTWEWDTPSLQDETDTYNNIFGWTIPSNASTDWNSIRNWDNPPTWNAADPHNDIEGDDLWTWRHHVERYGGSTVVRTATVSDWYDRVLQWYKDFMIAELDADDNGSNAGYGYDHMEGRGLALVYHRTGDTAALNVLNQMRTRIEGVPEYQTLAGGGTINVAQFEGRGVGRWALTAAYAVEATGDAAWITIRDNLVRGFETAPDWEEGGVIANGGGLYFASRQQAGFVDDTDSIAAARARYDAGYRFHAAWQIGILAEAMWRMYVQTGSAILRDRLIKMARYVQHYGHDPAWNFPNTGSRFGHGPVGERWWTTNRSNPQDGTATQCNTGPEYDAGLVNLCVTGYQLTGDSTLLEKARTYFSRCNRWNEVNGDIVAASINHVYRYVDIVAAPGNKYFNWNKGVWQYAYKLFENGGNPSIIGQSPPATYTGIIQGLADGMSSGSWLNISSSMDNTTFRSLGTNTVGTDRTILEYASDIFWNPNSKELHLRGGGASSGGSDGAQRHIRFGDDVSRGTWDAVTPWFNAGQAHQWGGFTGDPSTGDLYYLVNRGNKDLEKWDYTAFPGDGSWGDQLTTPFGTYDNAGAAATWFPELNSGAGGLAVAVRRASDTYQVYTSNAAVTSFTSLGNTDNGSHGIELGMDYLPGQGLVMFGGGLLDPFGSGTNFQIYTMDGSGTITKRNNIPFSYGSGDGGGNGTIVGHSNGRVFGVSSVSNRLYEWNRPSNDTWTDRGSLPASNDSLVATMIDEHDVIYVIAQLGDPANSDIQHWLYKL